MKCFCSNPDLSDRDLVQDNDGKDRGKESSTVDCHYLKILCLQIYSVTKMYLSTTNSILPVLSWSFMDWGRVEEN